MEHSKEFLAAIHEVQEAVSRNILQPVGRTDAYAFLHHCRSAAPKEPKVLKLLLGVANSGCKRGCFACELIL